MASILRRLDTGHFRRQIGMVLQDPYLFHGTVLENIRYGSHEAPLNLVVRGGPGGECHDFITKLQHGYDTVVGERGTRCRAGNASASRSRARSSTILGSSFWTRRRAAWTRRPSGDPGGAGAVGGGRTVLAIAHRLSTLRKASRLFVIEDGRLVEHGTHAELLAKPDGKYRHLYELQLQLSIGRRLYDRSRIETVHRNASARMA